MKLLISSSSKETGALLQEYLDARGVSRDANATVCYGSSTDRTPSLNSRCGLNKIERMNLMSRASVRTVPWFTGSKIPSGFQFPGFARKTNGFGGTDIVPVFQKADVAWRVAAGWDWFSSYIPVANEYRVWMFREQCLDTYEKVMNRPTEFKYIGRNFRNGFDFQLTRYEKAAHFEAHKALEAIGLDFGAVDMLRGEDGKIYILEVNTAPGVIKSGAQKTLGKLADQIVRWEQNDYSAV